MDLIAICLLAASLILASISYLRSRRLKIKFDAINESVVRSVMEESGVMAGPILKTFERLRQGGLSWLSCSP
jgi:hypothetical protein